ncbi:hypothetical protein ACKU27_13655 [Sphingobium yanoikuyae]|uniref:hypothetical protein n=1 Tax=Sphingobium yanoikuyae TaxID=13690 RepID=UPI003B918088
MMETRRQVIAAALAIPALSASVRSDASLAVEDRDSDSKGRAEWEAAISRYRDARAADVGDPYSRTLPSHPDFKRIEADHTIIADQYGRSLDAVMVCPVPDHAALSEKIAIMIEEFGTEDFIDCIAADVRMLGERAGS